ncbi:hypothetical protein ABIB50_001957 [Mucilaginibacter sp. UYCu711]
MNGLDLLYYNLLIKSDFMFLTLICNGVDHND